jgi:glycosyltransferase involved in cell wall biosynthesis
MAARARRIALDGLPLQVRSAGIATYTDALVRAMARQRPDAEFVLFGLTSLARFLLRAVPPGQAGLPFPPNVGWARTTLYPLVTGYPLPLPRVVSLGAVTGAVDVFHATNYVLPRAPKVPLVVTVHDLTLLRYPELGTEALRRLVERTRHSVREARCVIADSEATRRDVIELLGAADEKVRAIPLACDADFAPGDVEAARARVAERFAIDRPYVLHVGTIEPRKNLERLVTAFGRARSAHRLPHLLVLAGAPGWGTKPVRLRVGQEGLEEVVRFTGPVSRQDLLALYQAADLFAYPSLYEGFGLPALEAMACGTPVLTSDVASLPEVVGDAALTVDPHDDEALAAAIARGVSDGSLRDRLRVAGPARARLFTWERCATETLRVYDDAVASGALARPTEA